MAATTLRNILSTRNLTDILAERESISSDILGHLDAATDPWGIKVLKMKNDKKKFHITMENITAGSLGKNLKPISIID